MTGFVIGFFAAYLAAFLLLGGCVTLSYLRSDRYPVEAADPVDEHEASTVRDQTEVPLTPADEQVLRMLAGAHFEAKVTLPSGRVLDPDEANALTSFYAPAYERKPQL